MPRETFPGGVRHVIPIRIPLVGVLDQAGAVTLLASLVVPFKAQLVSATYLPDVAGAGAGATQALRIRKGGATGTILATVTPTLALHVLGGPGIVGNVAATEASLAQFVDNETLSITKDAGTVFSAAGGTLLLTFWQRPQARR